VNKFRMTTRIASAVMLAIMVVGAISACAPAQKTPVKMDKITWVSPRGTLEVMDDYNLWVAKEMGYCAELGIELDIQPGPNEPLGSVKLVAEGQADVGFPSPGVIVTGNDTGVPTIMAYEMMIKQVFDFAIPKGSDIDDITDLAGKTIAVGWEGVQAITDPMLYEAGMPLNSVNYVVAGQLWGTLVSEGKADAALTWRGLASQWTAQGLELDYLVGKTFSDHPANGYVIKTADLKDPARVDLLTRFFKCVSMGLDFSRNNPRAAAQITYKQFPALAEQMTPQLAFNSMWELGCNYWDGFYMGEGYGYSDIQAWSDYVDDVYDLGQIKNRLPTESVVTNQFIKPANDFDHERTKKDALNFKLEPEWEAVQLIPEC